MDALVMSSCISFHSNEFGYIYDGVVHQGIDISIFVDFDNTLVFTDKANNAAYVEAIKTFLPEFDMSTFSSIKRLTKQDISAVLGRMYSDEIIQGILTMKNQIISKFSYLNKVNLPLVSLLQRFKEVCPVTLVTVGNRYRVESMLDFHGLSHLFVQKIYLNSVEEKKVFYIQLVKECVACIFEDQRCYFDAIAENGVILSSLFLIDNV